MTFEAPPPPPVRSAPWRRLAKRVGIVLGVVLACAALLFCTGVAYFAYDAYQTPRAERDMKAFAEVLCDDLVDGRADAVYAALSADARERYSAQDFADRLAARRPLSECEVVGVTYLFLLEAYVLIHESHGNHTFDLVKESGEWRVDSDILDDLDHKPSHSGGGGGGFGD